MEKARFKWVLRERNRKIAAKTEVLLSSRHVGAEFSQQFQRV